MNRSEREIAQQSQEKFEFYLVSLVFTLLALSIQTAEFGSSRFADAFEILGWLTLSISGIAGLSRLEYIPLIRGKVAIKDDFEQNINQIKELKLRGAKKVYVLETNSEITLDERLKEYEKGLSVIDPIIITLEEKGLFKYKLHRAAFVFGLSFLVVARAYPPLKQLVLSLT